jgi:hypothetical protein
MGEGFPETAQPHALPVHLIYLANPFPSRVTSRDVDRSETTPAAAHDVIHSEHGADGSTSKGHGGCNSDGREERDGSGVATESGRSGRRGA